MSIDIDYDKAKKIAKEKCDEEIKDAFYEFITELQRLSNKYTETMVVDSCTDFLYTVLEHSEEKGAFHWFKENFVDICE